MQEWSVQLAKESLIQSKQKGKVDEASAIQQAKPKDEDEEEDGPGGKGKKKNRGKGKAKGKQTGLCSHLLVLPKESIMHFLSRKFEGGREAK